MSKKIAITFPGQGAQPVGMLAGLVRRGDELLAAFPVFDPVSLDTVMESINA